MNPATEGPYITCILEKNGLLHSNGTIDINGILARVTKSENLKPTDSVYKQLEELLTNCNKSKSSAEIFKCLVARNDRYGFNPITDFDPIFNANIDLDDLFEPSANWTHIIENCSVTDKTQIYSAADVLVSNSMLQNKVIFFTFKISEISFRHY